MFSKKFFIKTLFGSVISTSSIFYGMHYDIMMLNYKIPTLEDYIKEQKIEIKNQKIDDITFHKLIDKLRDYEVFINKYNTTKTPYKIALYNNFCSLYVPVENSNFSIKLKEGIIFIDVKYLLKSKDDELIKAILLHEIGHLELNHTYKMTKTYRLCFYFIIPVIAQIGAFRYLPLMTISIFTSLFFGRRKHEYQADNFVKIHGFHMKLIDDFNLIIKKNLENREYFLKKMKKFESECTEKITKENFSSPKKFKKFQRGSMIDPYGNNQNDLNHPSLTKRIERLKK